MTGFFPAGRIWQADCRAEHLDRKTAIISAGAMTDFATIEADDLGRMLRGMGINLLCPDPQDYAPRIAHVLGLKIIRLDGFFGLLSWLDDPDSDSLIQLHADKTYAQHPYHAMLVKISRVGSALNYGYLNVTLMLLSSAPGKMPVSPSFNLQQTKNMACGKRLSSIHWGIAGCRAYRSKGLS